MVPPFDMVGERFAWRQGGWVVPPFTRWVGGWVVTSFEFPAETKLYIELQKVLLLHCF